MFVFLLYIFSFLVFLFLSLFCNCLIISTYSHKYLRGQKTIFSVSKGRFPCHLCIASLVKYKNKQPSSDAQLAGQLISKVTISSVK